MRRCSRLSVLLGIALFGCSDEAVTLHLPLPFADEPPAAGLLLPGEDLLLIDDPAGFTLSREPAERPFVIEMFSLEQSLDALELSAGAHASVEGARGRPVPVAETFRAVLEEDGRLTPFEAAPASERLTDYRLPERPSICPFFAADAPLTTHTVEADGDRVRSLIELPDDRVLVNTRHFYTIDARGEIEPVPLGPDITSLDATAMYRESDGTLWLGGAYGTLYRGRLTEGTLTATVVSASALTAEPVERQWIAWMVSGPEGVTLLSSGGVVLRYANDAWTELHRLRPGTRNDAREFDLKRLSDDTVIAVSAADSSVLIILPDGSTRTISTPEGSLGVFAVEEYFDGAQTRIVGAAGGAGKLYNLNLEESAWTPMESPQTASPIYGIRAHANGFLYGGFARIGQYATTPCLDLEPTNLADIYHLARAGSTLFGGGSRLRRGSTVLLASLPLQP